MKESELKSILMQLIYFSTENKGKGREAKNILK